MAATTERAILAGGCFWGMQQSVRRLLGVVSTRVGYSGGDVKKARYRNHGTHAELRWRFAGLRLADGV